MPAAQRPPSVLHRRRLHPASQGGGRTHTLPCLSTHARNLLQTPAAPAPTQAHISGGQQQVDQCVSTTNPRNPPAGPAVDCLHPMQFSTWLLWANSCCSCCRQADEHGAAAAPSSSADRVPCAHTPSWHKQRHLTAGYTHGQYSNGNPPGQHKRGRCVRQSTATTGASMLPAGKQAQHTQCTPLTVKTVRAVLVTRTVTHIQARGHAASTHPETTHARTGGQEEGRWRSKETRDPSGRMKGCLAHRRCAANTNAGLAPQHALLACGRHAGCNLALQQQADTP